MKSNKSHVFVYNGIVPRTLCGIRGKNNIIIQSGRKVTCKRCKKIRAKR